MSSSRFGPVVDGALQAALVDEDGFGIEAGVELDLVESAARLVGSETAMKRRLPRLYSGRAWCL
jgi:hypothetical protein